MFNTDFNLGLLAGHNIWQSVIIFAVVFIILKVIQGSSAEEKSWSWSATLLALAILPMAAFLPGEGFTWQQDLALSERSVSQIEFVAPLQFEQNSTNLIIPQEAQKPFITMEKIQTSLIILWFIGTLISLFKLAVAGYNAAKLRSSAYPFVTENDNWQSDVEIAISDEVNGPIVVGILKPMILLPRDFAHDMEFKSLKPLLFHELAHIKRFDNIFNLIERIVLSVYWWNPVMHFIAGRISEERELACDDRAAMSCGDQIIYAKSLLVGAKKLVGEKKSVLGLAVLRRESPLSKRIKRLTGATALGGVNMLRFAKNLSALFMTVLVLGVMTPRFAIGQVDQNGLMTAGDAEKSVDRLYSDGGVDAVLLEIELLSNDYSQRLYTESLVDVYELDNAQIARLIGTIDQMENDSERNISLSAIANEQELEGDTVEMLARAATGDQVTDFDEDDIAFALGNIEMVASDESFEGMIERSVRESLPTEEELDLIIEQSMPTEEELDLIIEQSIPSEEEMARMVIESLPTEEELERMIKESMPSEEELGRMAKGSMPSEEEIARMVKESLPSEEEMARIVKEAKADMPDKEEIARMVEEAKADLPDKEEMALMLKEALADRPSEEEIARMVEEMKANMPTKEQLAEFKQEMRENAEEFRATKEKLKELKEKQDKEKNKE
jgi:beta-lactamase regulating signal transducer with metallopeptidase domain